MPDNGMNLVGRIKKVITNPTEFFENVKFEKGVGNAFKYLAILSLINLIVSIISVEFSVPSISALSSLMNLFNITGVSSLLLGIALPVIFYIVGLVLSFVGAGIIHLFARLLKGKGDYSATYKALTYASTPSLLLGWIPWVGIIFSIYSFYLSLKGISKLHEVSMGRAFVIVFVVPFVIALIIAIILAGVAFVYFSSLFAGLAGSTGGLG